MFGLQDFTFQSRFHAAAFVGAPEPLWSGIQIPVRPKSVMNFRRIQELRFSRTAGNLSFLGHCHRADNGVKYVGGFPRG
jgi:hypothetical protein